MQFPRLHSWTATQRLSVWFWWMFVQTCTCVQVLVEVRVWLLKPCWLCWLCDLTEKKIQLTQILRSVTCLFDSSRVNVMVLKPVLDLDYRRKVNSVHHSKTDRAALCPKKLWYKLVSKPPANRTGQNGAASHWRRCRRKTSLELLACLCAALSRADLWPDAIYLISTCITSGESGPVFRCVDTGLEITSNLFPTLTSLMPFVVLMCIADKLFFFFSKVWTTVD